MLAWLLAWRRAKQPAHREVAANAAGLSVAISGDNTNSPIQIGLNEDEVGRVARRERSTANLPKSPERKAFPRRLCAKC